MYYCKNFFCLIYLFSLNLFTQELGDITIYNTDNSDLIYNKINCLEFDQENRLWIGTEDGLSVLDESNNNWFNFDDTSTPWCYLSSNVINTLEWTDDLSTMFIGTVSGINTYWDGGVPMDDQNPVGVWSPYFGSSCNPNTGIIKSLLYSNGLWAGSTDGLCVQYIGGEGGWLLENSETGWYANNITSIKKNPNNNMVAIGTMNGGLVTYDQEFDIYYSSNSDILDNTVLDLSFDQNNNIIICTPQAGLGVLTENGSWIWFNTVNSELTSNSLTNVIVDNNNNLWITTLENGLIHYQENTFYNYTTENSNLPDNKITCLLFDIDNHLWLGTENSGIVKINNPSTSINSNFDAKHTYIYPTILNSNFNINLPKKSIIKIFNSSGKLMHCDALNAGEQSINIHNYKPGLYLVGVQNIDVKEVFKLIKY